jgi:hypothetical protein
MILGRDRPTLPRLLTKRSFATQRFTKWSMRALHMLRAVERLSRSRWHTPPATTKRAIGLLVLLLAISGIWPLPLINVLPAVTIALLAIAYLQEDGLLLAIAFATAILSLVVFGFLVWTSADAIDHLFGNRFPLPRR